MTKVSSVSLFCWFFAFENSPQALFKIPAATILNNMQSTIDEWVMTVARSNFGTFLRWWFGPHTWIFNSKFSSRIRDFAIQNPVSGIQNFKEVLDLPYMKLGGRVFKSFLTHAMSYISNLFSALCQSAFFIAWQSGHGFSLVVVDSCYILSNYQVDRSSAMWVRGIHLRMDVTKTHLQNHSCRQRHRLCADLSKW